MSDQKNGSSYLSDDSSESSSGGGRKLKYQYPHKEMTNQVFALIPDQGLWSDYAPQTVRYHVGAVKVYIPGEDANAPRRVRVACKGRDCPVCRDLDKKYPQIKDQPFIETRRHTKLFVVVPLQFKRGQYTVDKNVQLMQLEYPFRFDKASRDSVNIEWRDLSHAIKSVIDKGVDPFEPSRAVVFERNRESEASPGGGGTRKVWRHTVVEDSSKMPVTVELPHDILEQVKNHYPLVGYARDLGIPDLQLLIDAGNAQAELVESLKDAHVTERVAIKSAMKDLSTQLIEDLTDESLKQWLDSAEKYSASRQNPAGAFGADGEGDDDERVVAPARAVDRAAPPASPPPTPKPATAVADLKNTGSTIAADSKQMSAADAVRAKYGLRR
jgi:hypothetical protein